MSCESGKKSIVVADESFSGSSDSLETFLKRLRDLCPDCGGCDGDTRIGQIQDQARHAHALASELGILKFSEEPWDCLDCIRGAEHLVDFDPQHHLAVKITRPPAFGLTPRLRSLPVANLRSRTQQFREVIELFPATPIEYLERWHESNALFGDDIRLASVIQWQDETLSFCITQPQYHGVPAEPREIEKFFWEKGWSRLKDPSGHVIFFSYAFGVMAIDAERRNCYLTEGQLQPFDVILCRPDEEMQRFLAIYPDS